jgi:hypothetical protein
MMERVADIGDGVRGRGPTPMWRRPPTRDRVLGHYGHTDGINGWMPVVLGDSNVTASER